MNGDETLTVKDFVRTLALLWKHVIIKPAYAKLTTLDEAVLRLDHRPLVDSLEHLL